jgi:uncharacterized OB-fold protein
MTDSMSFDSRPSPEPDYVSKPFFDAMARGVLSVQKCGRCGACQLGELICNQCFSSTLEWVPATGRGTIHSYAVVHLPYHPAFTVPYAVVSVELEEGPRLFANMAECEPNDLKVGMAVVMQASTLASGVTVPLFLPAG